MKLTNKIIAGVAVAASLSAVAPVASAQVSASVAVASTYLWRGQDLGSGTPAVSGDLSYSTSGAYIGAWASSGDTAAGTEYDLYVGYGASFGDFSIDASVWTYIYPTAEQGPTFDAGDIRNDNAGDLSEFILSLGFGPISASFYQNLNGADYNYYTLGASYDAFSLTIGGDDGDDASEYVHVDLSYSYNDNLAFTVSQVVDDNDETVDDDLKFVVSYSIPLQ